MYIVVRSQREIRSLADTVHPAEINHQVADKPCQGLVGNAEDMDDKHSHSAQCALHSSAARKKRAANGTGRDA